MFKRAWLLLWLPVGGMLAASCGSDSTSRPGGASGAAGVQGADAGEPGSAGMGSGASSSLGGTGSSDPGGSGGTSTGGAEPIGGNGPAGGAPSDGGDAAGGFEATGGAPPLVAEVSCLEHEDCLPVCNANGWPEAHCFGSAERFCSCESSGEPTCTEGTTEGCPTGTACHHGSQCMPYGGGVHGDPCDNGDECSPGFICAGFGNPLPSGESTACAQMCAPQSAPPSCDCTGNYCLGKLGLSDFSCDYPSGTPCSHNVPSREVEVAMITGPGELEPGNVYIVSAESQGGQALELEVCGSAACEGDHVCASESPGVAVSCFVQAATDTLYVYVRNQGQTGASVEVDVENDAMHEYKLSDFQSTSSLQANGYRRMLVTGLTANSAYELRVTTSNARDINLTVSNDLHAEQVVCDDDATAGVASCVVTVTQPAVWAVLTDTSGIGDGYTFKVTAE